MNRAGWLGGLARAVAVMGVAATALPALADISAPPPQYDIGGATEAQTLRILRQAAVDVVKVPVDQVFATCDAASLKNLGKPYPAEDGRLLGCLVPGGRTPAQLAFGRKTLIYPDDPDRPWIAHQILLHEAGHLLGWPRDHRRD